MRAASRTRSSPHRLGLVLAATYLVLATLSIAASFAVTDDKAQFALLQLPLLPALPLLFCLPDMSWPLAEAISLPLVALAFYLFGRWAAAIGPRTRVALALIALLATLLTLFWPRPPRF